MKLDPPGVILHASAVSVAGRGCLIVGAAGSGKSTLALEMIALGAELIADDRTEVTHDADGLIASAPQTIAGMIEARGAGILSLPHVAAPVRLIVDLDRGTASRLPPPRFRHLLGVACPVILGAGNTGLAAILTLALRSETGPAAPVRKSRAKGYGRTGDR